MSILIETKAHYVPEQSAPNQQRFVFAYQVTITNNGTNWIQLLRRHWVITDAHNGIQEVEGDGVIGEQPMILPGDHYRYRSGAMISTDIGTMTGHYLFAHADGHQAQEPIPTFSLTHPKALH